MAYHHVLVVYDGSSEAGLAVAAAADLAWRDRAQLTVATVVELERPGRHCAIGADVWNEVLRDAARADLDHAEKLVKIPADYTIFYGKPDEALLEGARALGCDAIMLPPRPRRALRRMLRRDHAPAISRRAHCAVLQPS
jgi:nucleotide-binding universal stress UspA family protein